MRLRMLSTSFSHCCLVILRRSWCKNSSSSALFDGLWSSIFLLITLQRFSVGFRSGDWPGLDRVLIWWSSICTFIDLAGALSCWKNQSSELGNIFRAEESFQDNLVHGLTNVPDSRLAEAPPDHHWSSTKFHSGWLLGLSRPPSNH